MISIYYYTGEKRICKKVNLIINENKPIMYLHVYILSMKNRVKNIKITVFVPIWSLKAGQMNTLISQACMWYYLFYTLIYFTVDSAVIKKEKWVQIVKIKDQNMVSVWMCEKARDKKRER